MPRLRRLDRWVRWITLAALTLATLAPGVSHALRQMRGETLPWAQICSAIGGMRRLQLPDGPVPGQVQHAFEHCTACVLHVPAAPPPPAAAATVARSDLAYAVPAAPQQAPRTLRTWVSAQPRAPPVC